MSSVDAPWSPFRANSLVAASSTATRRSSAVWRGASPSLVSIHSQEPSVKCASGEWRAGPRQPGRTRPRSSSSRTVARAPARTPGRRPGTHLGPGRPPGDAGRTCRSAPRSRRARSACRASSRRSSWTTYACQPWRSPSAADGVSTRCSSRSVYHAGHPLARGQQLFEPGELRDPDRAEEIGQPVVEPGLRDVEVAPRHDAVVAKPANGVGELRVVGRDGAALAGGDDLPRVKRQAAHRSERAAGRATVSRPEGPGGVLDEHDLLGHRGLQLLPARPAGRTGAPRARLSSGR